MKRVRINLYKKKRREWVDIEVPDDSKPSEVMNLCNSALDEHQRSCLWDWEFVNEEKV